MFSESFPCFLGQHSNCNKAQGPVELHVTHCIAQPLSFYHCPADVSKIIPTSTTSKSCAYFQLNNILVTIRRRTLWWQCLQTNKQDYIIKLDGLFIQGVSCDLRTSLLLSFHTGLHLSIRILWTKWTTLYFTTKSKSYLHGKRRG